MIEFLARLRGMLPENGWQTPALYTVLFLTLVVMLFRWQRSNQAILKNFSTLHAFADRDGTFNPDKAFMTGAFVISAGFSVALMDTVCPPSTVYAAYHRYAGPKQLRVWPWNGHEGGWNHQEPVTLAFLREVT